MVSVLSIHDKEHFGCSYQIALAFDEMFVDLAAWSATSHSFRIIQFLSHTRAACPSPESAGMENLIVRQCAAAE